MAGDEQILKVLQVFEPGVDGVFRHVESLANFLAARGVEVGLAYSSCRGSDRLCALVEWSAASGFPVFDMRVSNAPELGDVPAFLGLMRLCRSFKPDVIHAHSSKAGIVGRLVGALTGTPVFYTPNAYYGMGDRRGMKTFFFNAIERAFAGIGETINVSADEADFARTRLGVRAASQHVIPNPVDTSAFRPGGVAQRQAWRKGHGLPDDAIVLGALGRFSFQKDPMTLYAAFAEVCPRNPRLRLVHVGSGELREDCLRLAQDRGIAARITSIDYLPDTADFYRALDMFVMSSRYEGLSLAVLYALATNLPLVLTDVPGNRDFGKLGFAHLFMAEPGSPGALAAAIELCLARMGSGPPPNHRDIAERQFSEEVCFGRILELYKMAAGTTAPKPWRKP